MVYCFVLAMMPKPMLSFGNCYTSKKRKRAALSLEGKAELLVCLENGESPTSVAECYGVDLRTVSDIQKQKPEILKAYSEMQSSRERKSERKTLKKSKVPFVNIATSERSLGRTVSGPMMQTKTKSTNASEYVKNFEEIVSENNITPEQVYNAVETGILWRCMPSCTYAGVDKPTAIGFTKDMDRITVLACVNAAGTHRLKLLVIGKAARSRALKNVKVLPVHYKYNKMALMTREIFEDWFYECFTSEVKEHFKNAKLPEESMAVLLLNNDESHPKETLSSSIAFSVFFPSSITSLIQPMDQGVIMDLKNNYRKTLMRHLVSSDLQADEFAEKFTFKDAMWWIAIAWKDVRSITIQRSWCKLWPAIMLEKNPEGFTARQRKNTVEEIMKTFELSQLRGLDPKTVERWLDVDKYVPTTDLFTDDGVEMVTNPADSVQDDGDEIPPAKISVYDMVGWLTKAKSYMEKSTDYTSSQIMYMHLLLSRTIDMQREDKTQSKITDYFKKDLAGHRSSRRARKNKRTLKVKCYIYYTVL